VHVVKVADANGNSDLLSVVAGLAWVAAHADTIKVANLALGVDAPMGVYGPDPLNVATEWLRAAGVTVVVAAGNTPGIVSDPGFTAGALTVGAADLTGARPSVATWSGYGVVAGVSKPDVVASGVSVLSLLPAQSVIARNNPGSRTPKGLYRGSGTSQATAITAGIAALYLQAHPSADTTEVKSSIRAAARSLNAVGSGVGTVRATSDASNAAGDGEDGFNAEAWVAGAYAEDGVSLTTWLTELATVWFGDAQMGGTWSQARWSSQSWRSQAWRVQTWSSQSWRSQAWRSQAWRSQSWRSQAWRSHSWRTQAWRSHSWRSIGWVTDVTDVSTGTNGDEQ
jgi:serine protease AprX